MERTHVRCYKTLRRTAPGHRSVASPFFALLLLALALPNGAWAQLQVLPPDTTPMVFAGVARRIEVVFRNPGKETTKADLHMRLHQTTSAIAAPLYERPWKTLTVLPGQTVLETALLDFPAVRAETRFLVQWLDGTNTLLGKTEVRVFPTNLLARLQTLAGETPLGLFDPANQLQPLLRALAVPFQDLAEDGTDKFTGKLALFGPFASKSQMRASLAADIRALAKRGVAIVWLQPPPAPRDPLRPSFHIVRVGDGAVVVAQASLVARLAENPEAQLTLLQLAGLALHPVPLDLPETETSN